MGLSKDLNLIYGISFMDLFAVGLSVPLMANYLRDLGASHFTIGAIGSLYSILQTMMGPLIGSWSDIKDRKSVLLATLSVCSLSYPFLGLSGSIIGFTIVRVILGFTKHTQTLCKALITDLLPADKRAEAFGRSAAYGSLGFIVGPLIGGHIAEFPHGFAMACTLTGGLFIVNIVLASRLSTTSNISAKNSADIANTTTTTARGRPPARQWRGLWTEFRTDLVRSVDDLLDNNWSALWQSFLLRFLFGLTISLFFALQSVYLKEQFVLSQRLVGYTISYFSAIGTAAAFWVHHITQWLYKNHNNEDPNSLLLNKLYHFHVLMIVSFLGLYLAPSIQTYLLALAPFSVSCSVLRIATMELLLKQSGNNGGHGNQHRGTLSGSASSVMSVARFVAPVTSGLVGDRFGESAILLVAAVPALVGTGFCAKMRRDHDERIKKIR